MKKVYLAQDLSDAHLLKGFLEGEGIEAEVQGESLWKLRGEIPITDDTSPSVWVPDADYDRAMELVQTFNVGETSTPIEGKPWRCRCGEENEGQFTECWSCGKSRPNFEKGQS